MRKSRLPTYAATICCGARLPRSRAPRTREPRMNLGRPAAIGAIKGGDEIRRLSLPSPSRNSRDLGIIARSGYAGLDGAPITAPWLNDHASTGRRLHARPFGPANREAPSTTMTSSTPCANTAVTTSGDRRLFVEA